MSKKSWKYLEKNKELDRYKEDIEQRIKKKKIDALRSM